MQNVVERLEKYIIAGYQQTNLEFAQSVYGVFIKPESKELAIRYEIAENEYFNENEYLKENYGTGVTCTYKELFEPWDFEKDSGVCEFSINYEKIQHRYFEYRVLLKDEREPLLEKLLSLND